MISLHEYLGQILDELHDVHVDKQRITIVFPIKKNTNVIAKIDQKKVALSNTAADETEIDITQLPFYYYHDENDFKNRINKYAWDKPIYIYKAKVYYSPNDRVTLQESQKTNSYFLIINNHYYFDILNFLKSKEHKGDGIFYFVDYFNWATHTIVFTTLKKEGQLQIIFSESGLDIPSNIDLPKQFDRLVDAFRDNGKQFPKFIKSELVMQLAKNSVGERMKKFLEGLSEIINVAEQNFEIYIHDLSLENLKKDFIDHKNKYFNQLREILGKLTNQVIGLPLTIAASVFSTYKVSDSPQTLIVILVVFLLYAIYSTFLLRLQKEDVKDVKEMFNKDFNYIETSQFFVRFPAQLDDFMIAKTKINSRIVNLRIAIELYYVFFVISLLAFIYYLLAQLDTSFLNSIIFLIALAAVFIFAYYFLIKDKKKKN